MKTKFVSLVMATCLLLAPISSSYAWWGSGNSYSSQDRSYDGRSYSLNEFRSMKGYEAPKVEIKPSFWSNVGSFFSKTFESIKSFTSKSFNFVKNVVVKAFDSIKNVFVKEPEINTVQTDKTAAAFEEKQKNNVGKESNPVDIPNDKVEVSEEKVIVDSKVSKTDDVKDIVEDNKTSGVEDAVVEAVQRLASETNEKVQVETTSMLRAPKNENLEGFIPYKMVVKEMSDTDLNKEVAVQEHMIKDYYSFYARENGKVSSEVQSFYTDLQNKHTIASGELKVRQSIVGAKVKHANLAEGQSINIPNTQKAAEQDWQNQFYTPNIDKDIYFPVFKPENVSITSEGTLNFNDVMLKLENDFSNSDQYDNSFFRHLQGTVDAGKRTVEAAATSKIGDAIGTTIAANVASETTKSVIKTATSTAVGELISTKVYLLENDKHVFNEIMTTVKSELSNAYNIDANYTRNIISSKDAAIYNARSRMMRLSAATGAAILAVNTGSVSLTGAIALGSNVDSATGLKRNQKYEAGQTRYRLTIDYRSSESLNSFKQISLDYRVGRYYDKTKKVIGYGLIDANMSVVGCSFRGTDCSNERNIYAPK